MVAPGKNSGALREQWQGWATRFAALQAREKYMIVGAVVVAILFGGYSLWVEPAQLQSARLKKSLAQQQVELEQVRAQVVALASQSNNDPDAARRVQLQQLREQLAALDRDIKAFDGTLVAPSQAPLLLQKLLARHRGLALVSLTTLPPQPLIDHSAGAANKAGGEAKATKEANEASAAAMPGGNIYKHGIEIRLAGGYLDLLAYVSELESGSQKLLWGDMQLTVKDYPVSELKLTVYTLSLEATWLVV